MKIKKINWIRILKVIGFVASAFISFKLMATLCETKLDYILALAMTIVLQSSSFYFFDRSLKEKQNIKYLYSTLAILLFVFSIIGTISFQFALQNKAENDLVLDSDMYKQKKENYRMNVDMVKAKKDEIESIKLNYNNQITAINISIEDYRKLEEAQNQLYTFRIENLNKDKNKLIAELNKLLIQKNQELGELNKIATTPLSHDSLNVDIEHTKGYLGMLSKISKWCNYDIDILSIILQIFSACLFEATAICLHIEDVKRSITTKIKVAPRTTKNVLQADFQPKKLDAEDNKVKQVIGFNTNQSSKPIQPSKPSKAEIEEYINCMFSNSKDNYSPGYKKISSLTNLSQESCRKIKGHLEQMNVIQTEGTRTQILKNREEVTI